MLFATILQLLCLNFPTKLLLTVLKPQSQNLFLFYSHWIWIIKINNNNLIAPIIYRQYQRNTFIVRLERYGNLAKCTYIFERYRKRLTNLLIRGKWQNIEIGFNLDFKQNCNIPIKKWTVDILLIYCMSPQTIQRNYSKRNDFIIAIISHVEIGFAFLLMFNICIHVLVRCRRLTCVAKLNILCFFFLLTISTHWWTKWTDGRIWIGL